jgi:hypothetical protein
MRTHDPMGFARARRKIVTFPHGATNKSFLFLFFKKEALACFRPLLSASFATRAKNSYSLGVIAGRQRAPRPNKSLFASFSSEKEVLPF